MISDKKQCIEFWQILAEKIKIFDELDDSEIVFGARTRGGGHKYRRLPIVTDHEIASFENNNGFELPIEYKTYLQTFGAGGGGPDYGLYDFRKHVLPYTYKEPFPCTEEVWYDDLEDDDPIWDHPGIAFIGDHGCGATFGIELNGHSPGRIWSDWAEACSPLGTLIEFYQKWIDKVENGLKRYHILKTLMQGKTFVDRPQNITLNDLMSLLQCSYKISEQKGVEPLVQAGERRIFFDKTPARVVVDEKNFVLRIELFDKCSIT